MIKVEAVLYNPVENVTVNIARLYLAGSFVWNDCTQSLASEFPGYVFARFAPSPVTTCSECTHRCPVSGLCTLPERGSEQIEVDECREACNYFSDREDWRDELTELVQFEEF